jgi:hypothetical protein
VAPQNRWPRPEQTEIGGWADLNLIDDQEDRFAVGEVNQQALVLSDLKSELMP